MMMNLAPNWLAEAARVLDGGPLSGVKLNGFITCKPECYGEM